MLLRGNRSSKIMENFMNIFELPQECKDKFEKQFKDYVKKNRNLDIEIVWEDENLHPKSHRFTVYYNGKRKPITPNCGDLDDFCSLGREIDKVEILKKFSDQL